jgi:DNA-binding LytR/AlgR family response regulator
MSAVIADDEPRLAAYLEKTLRTCWPELEIVGRAANGEQALQMIGALQPDVAFLDVQMPGLSGLEVAARLVAQERAPDAAGAVGSPCRLVFVTAFDQYAIEAFESAAVDYLLKPVTAERLAKTVERLRSRAPGARAALGAGPLGELRQLLEQLQHKPSYLHWLQLSVRDEITLLPVAEVDVFQSSDKYTLVRNAKGEWLLRTALKDLEPQLDPQEFWRIHRGAIVRVAAIARVSRDLRGQFLLELRGNARKLVVSRPYAHLFRAM